MPTSDDLRVSAVWAPGEDQASQKSVALLESLGPSGRQALQVIMISLLESLGLSGRQALQVIMISLMTPNLHSLPESPIKSSTHDAKPALVTRVADQVELLDEHIPTSDDLEGLCGRAPGEDQAWMALIFPELKSLRIFF